MPLGNRPLGNTPGPAPDPHASGGTIMKRTLCALIAAASIATPPVIRSPGLQARLSAQEQASVPTIPFESVPNPLKLPPDMHFGEVAGVAVNSKGHVFVF